MFIKIRQGNCYIESNNHYFGYGVVKTKDSKIIYIKGAPRLYRDATISGVKQDEVIENSENLKSSTLVSELLKCSDINEWGKYLTGNFLIVIVDQKKSKCAIITDLGNSSHLFSSSLSDANKIFFSTDIDRLAFETNRTEDIDYVSIVDYLTQQSITYPYTYYNGLKEVSFASHITCCYKDKELYTSEYQYWLPSCSENESSSDLSGLSERLRIGVRNTVEEILSDKKNIALFLSGGIDSRVIAGLMAELGVEGQAITIADSLNRETGIARKIAQTTGLKHKVFLRDLEYYPNLIKDSIVLEGPHFDFTWNMFLGFRNEIKKYRFDAVLGGYMSDTLLKLHEANVKAKYFLGRHLGTLERFDRTDLRFLRGGSKYLKQFSSIFKSELLEQVKERRKKNLEYWSNLRTEGSAWEWSYIWPFMRNKHNPNLTTNIFNHPSFEIYTDRSCIEVARIASQKIKINGRLFNKAMYPFMKRTLGIPIYATMLPLYKSAFFREFSTALKYMLPRRWIFREPVNLRKYNPIATDGSLSDLYKLWKLSTVLKRLKGKYNPSTIESKITNSHTKSVFDLDFYGNLSKKIRYHIMYTLFFLDIWYRSRFMPEMINKKEGPLNL